MSDVFRRFREIPGFPWTGPVCSFSSSTKSVPVESGFPWKGRAESEERFLLSAWETQCSRYVYSPLGKRAGTRIRKIPAKRTAAASISSRV